ncbi:MAG: LysR substrate-binding domain-containing protein [Reinekea forsetii]|nr:LysR substrate-binding domain-containing protein [Reinekea forsetii]
MHLNSIKRLEYFSDIAISGSFSKSAQRLGIAQPALSIAIKKLEEETGLKLINRGNRTMTLTSDGKVMLKHAHQILADLADAGRELTELRGLARGEINIGASAMLSTYFLPSVLIGFKQAYPGVRIRLVEAGTHTLEQMIVDGELDIALLQSVPPNDDIRYAAKLSEQVVACLPIDHELAQQSSISIEQYSQQPSVMFRQGYYLRDAVEQRAHQAKVSLNIQFETNLIDLLKQLVRSDVGIATCLAMIVENEADLCVRPFEPAIRLELAWGWKKNHYLSKAAQAFLTFYENHVQN